jgi:N6-L-threonylcarbamoyladenine synthase
LDSHLKLIGKVEKILPVSRVVIEVAAFDIQKIKNPAIEGEGYQNGEQKGFGNVREYVLYRDGHTCQHCQGRSKAPVLQVHHLETRQKSGDRPDNLITLCKTCHNKVSLGKLVLKVRPSPGFKAETFMTMVRWRLVEALRETGDTVNHTYGYLTKSARVAVGFEKSHVNDAFIIAGGTDQERLSSFLNISQVRKCNRKLFKGARSHIRNTGPRFIQGFQRYDKVRWNGTEAFVFGRRSSGYFDLRKLDGLRVHAAAKAADLRLLESANAFLIERKVGKLGGGNSSPS